jgi:hypothetical protein
MATPILTAAAYPSQGGCRQKTARTCPQWTRWRPTAPRRPNGVRARAGRPRHLQCRDTRTRPDPSLDLQARNARHPPVLWGGTDQLVDDPPGIASGGAPAAHTFWSPTSPEAGPQTCVAELSSNGSRRRFRAARAPIGRAVVTWSCDRNHDTARGPGGPCSVAARSHDQRLRAGWCSLPATAHRNDGRTSAVRSGALCWYGRD